MTDLPIYAVTGHGSRVAKNAENAENKLHLVYLL